MDGERVNEWVRRVMEKVEWVSKWVRWVWWRR